MTTLLERTFADHEHLAPDVDATLDAIRTRIRTRRRSRLAVTGAVLAVAGVVIGAMSLADPGAHRSVRPAAIPPPTAPPVKPPARAALPAPDYVTIAAGWLPPGTMRQVFVSNAFDSQLRGYDVTPAAGPSTYVLIGLQPGTALPTTNKRGTPHSRTVGGRPAREWSVDDWYNLAILLPGGQVATVDIEGGANQGKGGDGSAATLATIGRQVAAHLRHNRHDLIRTGFALSYVPRGLAVRGVTYQPQQGTSYTLAPPDARSSNTMPDYATIAEQPQRNPSRVTPSKLSNNLTPGRPVQGHETYVATGNSVPMLLVNDVRPGVSIQLTGGPGTTTLAELYKIADGLILAH